MRSVGEEEIRGPPGCNTVARAPVTPHSFAVLTYRGDHGARALLPPLVEPRFGASATGSHSDEAGRLPLLLSLWERLQRGKQTVKILFRQAA